jgi:hypothetical protein
MVRGANIQEKNDGKICTRWQSWAIIHLKEKNERNRAQKRGIYDN